MTPQKNTRPLTAEQIDAARINIAEGKLTFGQRIELGKILQSDKTDVEKFQDIFISLHQYKPAPSEYKTLIAYSNQILEGLAQWVEKENTLLNYSPTAEEIQAGIKDLNHKIGEMGTVKTLAKNYGKDPDEILGWEYAKVFGILYTDLEEYRYQQRYQKIIDKKYHHK